MLNAKIKSNVKHAWIVLLTMSWFIHGCYISKPLESEVHVSINEFIQVSVINNGNSNFSGNVADAEYINQFLTGIKAELQSSNVVLDNASPQFEISFTGLVITESTRKDTVKDVESPDNGKIFELTTLDIEASGKVKKISNGAVENWTASKDKSEKVQSYRTVGQMINGENKERNEYRENEFDTNEAASLANSCGRRSGVVAVKDIARL